MTVNTSSLNEWKLIILLYLKEFLLATIEYNNYSVCLSYIMIVLYIWSYQCNVACSTMCTERLVRLTIERYVLLVAHIIRRCTTCSIESWTPVVGGLKQSCARWIIVYTFNNFPAKFLSYSRGWETRITSRRQSEIGTVSGVCISFLKRNVVPVEEDRVKPVRTFVLL